VLDIVLIRALDMGTAGAGLATVIAQLISGLLCIIYLIKKHPMLHVKRHHFKTDIEMDRHLLKIGIPMAFLNMVLSIGSIIVQFVTNGFGDSYVSAQVTGSKIENFLVQPLIAYGSAVSVFTAQNHGAGNYKRVIEGSKKTLLMCFIWCAIAATLLVSLGKPLIMLIAGEDVSETVIKYAYEYILINTAFTLILSMLIVYKSILQSVDKTTWPMISGFTEIVGRAGISIAVSCLISASVLDLASAYTVMCFATPTAWVCGLIPVMIDYIIASRRLSRRVASELTTDSSQTAE
jgi:Na+-driven multidrug efflux pump